MILQYIPHKDNVHILDIGCGNAPDAIEAFTESVCEYLESVHPDLTARLETGVKMSDDDVRALKDAIAERIAGDRESA